MIHDRVRFFRAEAFREGREALHVAEHHRDLFTFALDTVSLGEDLLGQDLRQVALDLGELLDWPGKMRRPRCLPGLIGGLMADAFISPIKLNLHPATRIPA